MKRFKAAGFLIFAFLPTAQARQNNSCNFTEESRALAEKGEFYASIRSLPDDIAKWDRCIAVTGRSFEGSRGYLRSHVLDLVSLNGDAEWGKIWDDPKIAYRMKTDILFEILEARLGKGSVFLGNDETIIVPRNRPINLDREMIRLP